MAYESPGAHPFPIFAAALEQICGLRHREENPNRIFEYIAHTFYVFEALDEREAEALRESTILELYLAGTYF